MSSFLLLGHTWEEEGVNLRVLLMDIVVTRNFFNITFLIKDLMHLIYYKVSKEKVIEDLSYFH